MTDLAKLKRRATRARNAALVTCPASRHLALMADALAAGRPYPMLTEEPQYCAESMLAVCAALWEARNEIAELNAGIAAWNRRASTDKAPAERGA